MNWSTSCKELTILSNCLEGWGGVQAAAMGLQATDQGLDHRSTATNGVVKMGFGFEPFTEQRGHGRRVGVSARKGYGGSGAHRGRRDRGRRSPASNG